jgi:hypothetical protein
VCFRAKSINQRCPTQAPCLKVPSSSEWGFSSIEMAKQQHWGLWFWVP